LETAALGGNPAHLPLGVLEVESCLPEPGLRCGVLHEVGAAGPGDQPAALGFLCALMACALKARPGVGVFIASRRGLADGGDPYGHGLNQLGVDLGRFLLVKARTAQEALWALEEGLRSEAAPAVVAGAVESPLDFTASRRLNLAAAVHGTPLLLLRAREGLGASAAATRWRIGAAPAARDAFGAIGRWRWAVALERCRHGRSGEWVFEWDHAAHRFHLAAGLAAGALAARPGLLRAG
jgi:protein ImuA